MTHPLILKTLAEFFLMAVSFAPFLQFMFLYFFQLPFSATRHGLNLLSILHYSDK